MVKQCQRRLPYHVWRGSAMRVVSGILIAAHGRCVPQKYIATLLMIWCAIKGLRDIDILWVAMMISCLIWCDDIMMRRAAARITATRSYNIGAIWFLSRLYSDDDIRCRWWWSCRHVQRRRCALYIARCIPGTAHDVFRFGFRHSAHNMGACRLRRYQMMMYDDDINAPRSYNAPAARCRNNVQNNNAVQRAVRQKATRAFAQRRWCSARQTRGVYLMILMLWYYNA